MTDPEAKFDPRAAIAQVLNSQVNRAVRKLTFFDRCAAFYCLYNGAGLPVVEQVFGISKTAASQIGGCLRRDPRPFKVELVQERVRVPVVMRDARGADRVVGHEYKATGELVEKRVSRDMNRNRLEYRKARYRSVAEEFERLGEEAFAARYYTEAIHQRVMRVKYDLEGERSRRLRLGADPHADEGPDLVYLPDGQAPVKVGWVAEPRNEGGLPGWYVIGEYMDIGPERTGAGPPRPFKTKKHARIGVWRMNGYTDIPSNG